MNLSWWTRARCAVQTGAALRVLARAGIAAPRVEAREVEMRLPVAGAQGDGTQQAGLGLRLTTVLQLQQREVDVRLRQRLVQRQRGAVVLLGLREPSERRPRHPPVDAQPRVRGGGRDQ